MDALPDALSPTLFSPGEPLDPKHTVGSMETVQLVGPTLVKNGEIDPINLHYPHLTYADLPPSIRFNLDVSGRNASRVREALDEAVRRVTSIEQWLPESEKWTAEFRDAVAVQERVESPDFWLASVSKIAAAVRNVASSLEDTDGHVELPVRDVLLVCALGTDLELTHIEGGQSAPRSRFSAQAHDVGELPPMFRNFVDKVGESIAPGGELSSAAVTSPDSGSVKVYDLSEGDGTDSDEEAMDSIRGVCPYEGEFAVLPESGISRSGDAYVVAGITGPELTALLEGARATLSVSPMVSEMQRTFQRI